jgi:hypothetical protein
MWREVRMPDSAVEKLFSLFASPDRAEALAGDLAEEREQRGSSWFWLHVVRITLALWRSAVREAPLRVLALTLAGCALLAAPALAGTAAVFLFPWGLGSLVSWMALAFIWWSGALWTGASLVALAPRRGMAACATLAVAGAALLIVFGVGTMAGPWGSVFLHFYTTGLMAAVPLLAGGAVARRRLIGCGAPLLEPHR